MSSRNAYLTDAERPKASKLHATLKDCAEKIRNGENPEKACNQAIDTLTKIGFSVDYLTLRNAETLAALESLKGHKLRLLVAAQLGKPRLIDNIAVNY